MTPAHENDETGVGGNTAATKQGHRGTLRQIRPR